MRACPTEDCLGYNWLSRTNRVKGGVSLSPGRLTNGFSDGRAERGAAVQGGDTHLELGELTVEVASGQTLAQQFDTLHPFAGKTVPRIVF